MTSERRNLVGSVVCPVQQQFDQKLVGWNSRVSFAPMGFDDCVDLGPILRFGCRHGINDRAPLDNQHDKHVWLGIVEAHDDAAT